jgi:hypothetical protein
MTSKISTLIDNFSANDLSTLWAASFGTVNWSTGQVAIKCDTSHDSALATNGPYDLTSSSLYMRFVPYVATDAQFSVQLMEPSNNENKLHFGYNGSNFVFYKTVSGTQTELGTVAYNSTTMAWWRVREASGTSYIDTAPDSSGSPGTWTNQFSTPDTTFNFPLTSVEIQMLGGDYGSDPAGYAYIYAVNSSVYKPVTSGLVYMGGYNQGGTNTYATDWAVAQGLPNADGGFQSLYQWGNGWTGTNSVESVQVATADQMAGYPGPCCLNVAMCESDSETSLANSLSGSSLTSGCQAAHAATAVACLASNVQYIRMAWEFNGGQNYNWMPPFSSYTAAEFKLLWQLIYNVYSSAAVNAGKPANWFKFIYCMVQNDSNGNADMANYYPGMPYASYITIDEYDRTGGGYTGWAEALNDQPTVTEMVTYALAQGALGVGMPEWGIRDDAYGPSVIPDPSYINSAFSWAQATAEQGLNVLMWPWGAGYTGSISGIAASTWNFAAWPTMWSALTSDVAAGISAGWIATTYP